MNNTTTTLTIVAVLAATLVIGVTSATTTTTTTTPSAFAYNKYDGSGNTITPQINKQYGIQSGFDNSFDQELQNLLCTHPSATCSTEGSEGVAATVGSSSGDSSSSPDSSGDSSSSPDSGLSIGIGGGGSAQEGLPGLSDDIGLPALQGLPGLILMGQK